MMTSLLAGALVGLGVLIFLRGVAPRPVPLRAALRRDASPTRLTSDDALDRWGTQLVPLADSMGLSLARLRADLDITGRSLSRHLAEKVALAIFGVCLVSLTSVVMTVGGVHLGFGIPIWVAFGVSGLLFFVPDLGIKAEAVARRQQFRFGLGSFLDLVVIGLAGGAGVEAALEEAATTTKGFAGERLRQSLMASRLRGETPWAAMGRLGDELGINELVELSACVGLAGVEGARVRQSLSAKAASLRAHQLAEAEAEAQATSERMSLPVVVLFLGFLVFIGYPAMSRVLVSL